MQYEVDQFLKSPCGIVLEVIYADEEKAVCLKVKQSHEIGWLYTGASIVISNAPCDYVGGFELERVPAVNIDGKYRWEPLIGTLNFPMF